MKETSLSVTARGEWLSNAKLNLPFAVLALQCYHRQRVAEHGETSEVPLAVLALQCYHMGRMAGQRKTFEVPFTILVPQRYHIVSPEE